MGWVQGISSRKFKIKHGVKGTEHLPQIRIFYTSA